MLKLANSLSKNLIGSNDAIGKDEVVNKSASDKIIDLFRPNFKILAKSQNFIKLFLSVIEFV